MYLRIKSDKSGSSSDSGADEGKWTEVEPGSVIYLKAEKDKVKGQRASGREENMPLFVQALVCNTGQAAWKIGTVFLSIVEPSDIKSEVPIPKDISFGQSCLSFFNSE